MYKAWVNTCYVLQVLTMLHCLPRMILSRLPPSLIGHGEIWTFGHILADLCQRSFSFLCTVPYWRRICGIGSSACKWQLLFLLLFCLLIVFYQAVLASVVLSLPHVDILYFSMNFERNSLILKNKNSYEKEYKIFIKQEE